MNVEELALRIGARAAGPGTQASVSGVQHDSREVRAGDVFVAIPGHTADGAAFATAAVAQGAVAVIAERALDLRVPSLTVAHARRALGQAAHAVYGDPTAALRVVGVTGTNGKTTTTWLLESALAALGARPAMLGTVAARIDGVTEPSAFTTPEADDLARFAARAVTAGATHLVMEVSSHALALDRVTGTRFAVAALTNLTQDHLDFHGTMEAYAAAKAQLFQVHAPAVAVLNTDDPLGAQLAASLSGTPTQVIRVSPRGDAAADVRATRRDFGREGLDLEVSVSGAGAVRLTSPLLGAHNAENLLVALGCLLGLGHDAAVGAKALGVAQGAPGRLEPVPAGRGVSVVVDYAHSPDALSNVLRALRPLTPGRLIVVFGCGGDRDRSKRPQMGRAVREGADLAVVTSDNPRTEDPGAIVREVLAAFEGAPLLSGPGAAARGAVGHIAIVDRREAIRWAIDAAAPGDTVLIAGKGHEDYQIIGREKLPFDDRVEAREALRHREEA